MKKVELLAPAGSIESLYAAINNGADAVYLGGSKFSARAYASNFDNETMKKAVDYCHSYGVKIYVTMNTLLKEKELNEAIKYVGYLYEIGVDALIVQDLGLVNLIQEKYSDFEIHASTQVTIHNGEGAFYFKEKGFTRIVLSRELSLEEIKHISKDLNIETEIFIHGALCVCYSGQCLMSSMIGGRSGNRGRCAQPCRMEYTLKSNNMGEKKAYLLSPKDICTIENIKDIIDSGAYSLKIEGRMKRPEYVAGVVENYREAIDKEYYNKNFNVQEGKKVLLQLFNREGFSTAYLKKNIGRDMMSYKFPKNTGVEIGKVLDNGEIILKESLSIGDGIRFKDKGFTLSKILKNKQEVKKAEVGERVILFPREYKKGEILYRTSSKELFLRLEDSIKPYMKKIFLKGQVEFKVNSNIKLKTSFMGENYEVEGNIIEVASNKPLDKERIVNALKKSGEYPYKLEDIEFLTFEDGFISISSLNNLRRELFDKILKNVTSKYRRRRNVKETLEKNINLKENKEDFILYTCCTKKQLKALVEEGIKDIGVDLSLRNSDKISLKDLEEYKDLNLYILTPEIIKQEFNFIVKEIEEASKYIKGVITSNAGIINVFKNKLYLIGDYKLNIFNSKALEFYRKDLNNVSLSLEINRKEIKEINDKSGALCGIYGKAELMVSEYCPIGSSFGGKCKDKECNGACMKDSFTLVDRMNEGFKVMTDKYCRSHILNSLPLNLIDEIEDLKSIGINSFRVDFKDEDENEVIEILKEIRKYKRVEGKKFTKGHYRRGVE